MLIHDTTNHLGGSLLSAFHYNDVIHLRHLDGVKAYQLHDGIGNPLVSDALGHLEILQLVIHKVDDILILSSIQILQCRRE